MRVLALAAMCAGALIAADAFAEPAIVAGTVRVIDGDTISVDNTRVRLKGVDAAEMNTERGRDAKAAMIQIVRGHVVVCTLTGEKTFKREVGHCVTDDNVDIGQAIIEQGAALACPRYSTLYLPFEQPAARAVQKRARYC